MLASGGGKGDCFVAAAQEAVGRLKQHIKENMVIERKALEAELLSYH